MSSVDDGTAQPGRAVVGARERMEYYAISNRRQRRRAQPAENTRTRPNILIPSNLIRTLAIVPAGISPASNL